MIGFTRRAVVAVGAAALLTGSILGTAAFAADPAPAEGTPTAKTERANRAQEYGQSFLAKLAAALGVDQAKLTESIKTAGIETIDEAVAKGDLAQNRADAMKERIAEGRQSLVMPFGGRGGPMGGERGMPGKAGMSGVFGLRDGGAETAIAEKLGLTTDQLHEQLRAGKSLTDLATEKGVSADDLKAVATAAHKAHLDQAVADGKLTQAQADAMLERMESAPLLMMGGQRGRR